jgi:hypothetical protein
MTSRILRTMVAVALAVSVLPAAMSATQAPPQTAAAGDQVTFAKDIAPILQRACQRCHRPDSIAPMSLMTYEEVRPWARAIKARTSLGPRSGVMPPWYMEKNIGIQKYKDDPSLSAEEIAKIAKWIDSGAPFGNPADLPPAQVFADARQWQIGKPDLIVSTPTIQMKAMSPDWWGAIGEAETGLTEDRYVAAVEYKEISESQGQVARQTVGGRFIVHHLSTRIVVGDEPQDAAAGGLPTHEVGRNPDIFDPDAGRLLRAGSKLVFSSAHLHSNGRDTKSHIDIAFKFHPKGYQPRKTIRRMGLFGNSMNLDIRPMEANQKFQAFTVLADNAKIVAFEPHMHAAGVRMCLDAIWGAGVSFETLSCVGYDHSWVRIYTFADDAAPLLPKGTILRITGTFDNTPANKNVADPRNWSGLGHRSIDNMMNQLGEIQYLTDEDFQREMVQRRIKLGLKERQSVLGCPLCGTAKLPPTTTASGQQ